MTAKVKKINGKNLNWLDRAIAPISPRMAYRRAQYRTALSAYDGADRGRKLYSWTTDERSANREIGEDLRTLRERSHDLVKNDGHAAGIFRAKADQVVGRGLRPQANIDANALGISVEKAEEIEDQIQRAWARMQPFLDVSGIQSGEELQWGAYWNECVSGESLFVFKKPRNQRGPYPVALMQVDPARIGKHRTWFRQEDIGIDIDDDGAPTTYHILKSHPGDGYLLNGSGVTPIPARDEDGRRNVIHLFERERPGQLRGLPDLTPALAYFKHLHEVIESEVIAQRVTRAFALIYKSENPAAMMTNQQDDTDSSSGVGLVDMNPGIIAYAGLEDELDGMNVDRPGTTFDPFIERMLRLISACVGLPYSLVAMDYTGGNFAQERAAILDARRYFQREQQRIARHFCQPVYEHIIEYAMLAGDVDAPDFYKKKDIYCRATWIPDGWQWIDPWKDVQAEKVAVENNMNTLANALASRGLNIDEVMSQRSKEKRRVMQNGLADLNKESEVDKALREMGASLRSDDLYGRYLRPMPDNSPDAIGRNGPGGEAE